MGNQQWARADENARITQVAGDHITYAAGAGPAPRALLGLPDAPAALVGRDGPVKELVGLLAEGGPPVVVVAGLAGVGKSALAVSTAHRAVELGWFGDRVFFLSLRGYAPDGGVSGPQAVQEMLRHLGLRDADMPESPEGRVALYRARLAAFAQAGQRVLIVADDAGSVGQVRDLVPAADAHRLLVTSRHRLVAPGFAGRVLPLDELAEGPAAELLADAVLRAWPDDPRPSREPEALAGIARRCGRLPLALAVAGAVLAGDPGLSAGELAQRLAEARSRLEALTFDEGGVPVGVRAAFDLSYARLPADQARIFRLLTVNPGPDCRTGYAGLLTGEGEDVRPKLAALVRASLLTEQPVGSGRWRMHDLLRLYALERGEECAEEDGREEATDTFLADLVVSTGVAQEVLGVNSPGSSGPGLPSVAQALDWLDTERPLLAAAVGFAADSGRVDTAVELADLLAPYLQLYGHAQEHLLMARHVLAAVRTTGRPDALAVAVCDLGSALCQAHDWAEATDRLTEALTRFRESSDREGEGRALNLLGTSYSAVRRYEEARHAHQEALDINRELGNRHAEAAVLVTLGADLQYLGRLDEAIAMHRQSLALMRELGDRHREVIALDALGDALGVAGRREECVAVREEALVIVRGLGNRTRVAWTLTWIASSLLSVGQADEVQARFEEALSLFTADGNRQGEGVVLTNLGLFHVREGRLAQALEAHERACVLLAAARDQAGQAGAARALAYTLGVLGRLTEAEENFERAAAGFAAVGDAKREAECREEAAAVRELSRRPRRWWHRFTR
ncbi:tetratricopeptide repeat protein [Streptomyces sp. NPDC001549]|uniref:tetratricopeptide repeat protein n=1 Tax=Streptomyces sp. NPDC001549 TaxID=3364586 RepID=UPI0036D16C08